MRGFAHLRAILGNTLQDVILQVPCQLHSCRTLLLRCLPSSPQGAFQGPPQLLQVNHVRLLLTWSSPGAVRNVPLSLHGAVDKLLLPRDPFLASGCCPWRGSLEGYDGFHVGVTLDRPEGFNSSWLPYGALARVGQLMPQRRMLPCPFTATYQSISQIISRTRFLLNGRDQD